MIFMSCERLYDVINDQEFFNIDKYGIDILVNQNPDSRVYKCT